MKLNKGEIIFAQVGVKDGKVVGIEDFRKGGREPVFTSVVRRGDTYTYLHFGDDTTPPIIRQGSLGKVLKDLPLRFSYPVIDAFSLPEATEEALRETGILGYGPRPTRIIVDIDKLPV